MPDGTAAYVDVRPYELFLLNRFREFEEMTGRSSMVGSDSH